MPMPKFRKNNRPRNPEKAEGKTKDSPSRFSLWVTEWITDWWGIEIVCWVVATLSLASIVIILESSKNKPLPQWPLGLTINSMISILATIGQMAMMKPTVECISQLKWLWFVRKERLSAFQAFDDASRGPTGSLILLGKLRGLHLICLGAAITVVSIAFGTFAQQVVTYPLHPIADGNSSVSQVFYYHGLNPSCGTGNCTWDPYPSLGICSSVVDVSPSVVKNPCNQTILDEIYEDTTGVENPGYKCFNYTLPAQGNVLDPSTDSYSVQNMSLTNLHPIIDNIFLPEGGESHTPAVEIITISTTQNALNNTIMVAYVLFQPEFFTSTNFSLLDPVAYELALEFCLQTLNTSVKYGVTSTVVNSSQSLANMNFKQSNLTATVPGSANNISIQASTIDFEGSVFGFTNAALWQLQTSVADTFDDACLGVFVNATGDDNDIACGSFSGPILLNTLMAAANATSSDTLAEMEAVMDNVAISMTNAFRTPNAFSQGADFQGKAYSPFAFVETDYYWLILPIALVALTLVFLLATISKSQRLGSRIWKSSNFATLQGLDIDLHAKLGGLSSRSEMDEKAEKINVRFDGKAGSEVEYRLLEVKQEEYWRG